MSKFLASAYCASQWRHHRQHADDAATAAAVAATLAALTAAQDDPTAVTLSVGPVDQESPLDVIQDEATTDPRGGDDPSSFDEGGSTSPADRCPDPLLSSGERTRPNARRLQLWRDGRSRWPALPLIRPDLANTPGG
jgi:hypothetical protein